MRIITFALQRAQNDPEKAKDYPKSYRGIRLMEDDTHIWMVVGREPDRRAIAVPKTRIVYVGK